MGVFDGRHPAARDNPATGEPAVSRSRAMGVAEASCGAISILAEPRFRKIHILSGVRGGRKQRGPQVSFAAQGPVRLGAPSIRLFLVRLRPRRAGLRFTGPLHCTRKRATTIGRHLTRSEVAIAIPGEAPPRTGAPRIYPPSARWCSRLRHSAASSACRRILACVVGQWQGHIRIFCLAKRRDQARRHDIRPLHSRNTV